MASGAWDCFDILKGGHPTPHTHTLD
jgi:hypothetical protein